MTMTKDLLRKKERPVAEMAESAGYASASTFSTAFSRHMGVTPSRYARGL